MDSKKLDILADKIKEAELILIGIGEEWEAGIADLLKSEKYKNLLDEIGKNNPLLPFIQKELLEDESNDDDVKQKIEEFNNEMVERSQIEKDFTQLLKEFQQENEKSQLLQENEEKQLLQETVQNTLLQVYPWLGNL